MARRGAARAARAALLGLVVALAAAGGALGVQECAGLGKRACKKSTYCEFAKRAPCGVAANPCFAIQGRKGRRRKCNSQPNCQCSRKPSGRGKCGRCVPKSVDLGDPAPSPEGPDAPASSFTPAAWLLAGLDGKTGSDTAANLCNGLFKKCYEYTWDGKPGMFAGNTVNCFSDPNQINGTHTASPTKYSDFKQTVSTCRMSPPGGSPCAAHPTPRAQRPAPNAPRPAPRAPRPAPRAPRPAPRAPRPAPGRRGSGLASWGLSVRAAC